MVANDVIESDILIPETAIGIVTEAKVAGSPAVWAAICCWITVPYAENVWLG